MISTIRKPLSIFLAALILFSLFTIIAEPEPPTASATDIASGWGIVGLLGVSGIYTSRRRKSK